MVSVRAAPAPRSVHAMATNDPGDGRRRFQLFDALVRRFTPGRALDLAAGHGKFSLRAADAGWDVTALDARDERFPADPRITWVRQDVRDADLSGYDLIFCLGLMYHLTVDDQCDLLKKAAGTPLVIDTHLDTGKPTWPLSEPVTVGGYSGRLFHEASQERPTASWGNEDSFWATVPEFYRMLADHGYTSVFEANPWYRTDRTFFLCLP